MKVQKRPPRRRSTSNFQYEHRYLRNGTTLKLMKEGGGTLLWRSERHQAFSMRSVSSVCELYFKLFDSYLKME